MIAAPHTRKGLIWITPGVPLGLQIDLYKAPAGSSGDGRTMAFPIMQAQAMDVTKAIFDLARKGTLRVTNDRNREVHQETLSVDAKRFITAKSSEGSVATPSGLASGRTQRGTGSSEFPWASELQHPLPLGGLKPGAYLLTIEATVGEQKLRRDVQFDVK